MIYLVTEGDYSDYKVLGVYSTPEKAAIAEKLYGSHSRIEEFELDAMPEHPQNMFLYCVRMGKEGDCRSVETRGVAYAAGYTAKPWRPYGDGETVAFYTWAKDEKHAIKIANEHRAMLIASEEWTTDFQEWTTDFQEWRREP